MNEWRMNEWTWWTKEGRQKRMNEWMNKWIEMKLMKSRTNEWMKARKKERRQDNEWLNEWMNEWCGTPDDGKKEKDKQPRKKEGNGYNRVQQQSKNDKNRCKN